MLRASPSVCLFCQSASIFRPQWTQLRTYAQAQRKRPSRMVLSNRVSQSSGPRSQGGRTRDAPSNPTRSSGSRSRNALPSYPQSTTTPRKERRAAWYKDVQEKEQARAEAEAPEPDFAPRERSFNDRRRKTRDGGLKTIPADRPRPGPFGALNQRHARVPQPRTPTSRSKAWAEGNKPARSWSKEERETIIFKPKERKEKGAREKGDYHSLKMQQALATVSYGARNQVKSKISEVDSFQDFPLLPSIQKAITQDALKALDAVAPTPIQKLAVPALLGMGESRRRRSAAKDEGGMKQFLLAAETGSGKTMAYLLPAIDALKRAEVEEARIEEGRKAQKAAEEKEKTKDNMFELPTPDDFDTSLVGRPRVIVLVPTAELVEQVGALAKSLSHEVKFRASAVSSNYSQAVIKNRLFSPMDILISTPHLLASISDSEPYILSKVSHLIIDEADSLLDRSFSPITSTIIDKATSTLTHLVMCSATIPRRLDNYLRDRFPDIKRLTTPNLHAIPRRVQLGVVDVEKDPYKGNKDLACADVIWKIGSSATEHVEDGEVEKVPTKRLIVFVNERDETVRLAEYLQSKGVEALALNRDLDTRTQTDMLAQFCSANPKEMKDSKTSAPKNKAKKPTRTLANTKVLVCTDIASRGIDTTAVRHVILYDVPHTSIDFIHRLGRTGRMGRRGRGVVLVGRHDRKDVVREIREAMFRGAALI